MTLTNYQKSVVASTYKTCRACEDCDTLLDVERAILSQDFQHYIIMGGLLTTDIDWQYLRNSFPRPIATLTKQTEMARRLCYNSI